MRKESNMNKFLYVEGDKKFVVEIVDDFGETATIKMVSCTTAVKGKKFSKKKVQKKDLFPFTEGVK